MPRPRLPLPPPQLMAFKSSIPTGASKEVSHVTKRAAADMLDAITNAPMVIEPGRADAEQIFLLYAGSCGDVAKTARACNVSMQEVIKLAEEGGWLARIHELIDLKKLDKFDDVGRALSRATNFIQANRWRLFLERAVRKFEEIPDEELLEAFKTYKVDKNGDARMTGFSLRVLADLSSALEKCHWLLYQSLLDTPSDRAARKTVEKAGDPAGESDIHARIARMMTGAGMKTVDQHVEAANDAVLPPVPPKPTS